MCNKRKLGCHSNCEEYNQYSKECRLLSWKERLSKLGYKDRLVDKR